MPIVSRTRKERFLQPERPPHLFASTNTRRASDGMPNLQYYQRERLERLAATGGGSSSSQKSSLKQLHKECQQLQKQFSSPIDARAQELQMQMQQHQHHLHKEKMQTGLVKTMHKYLKLLYHVQRAKRVLTDLMPVLLFKGIV